MRKSPTLVAMAVQILTTAMNKCIFCQVVAGESPSTKAYEDDEVVVIKNIKPSAPLHYLAIPKRHITSIAALTRDDIPLMGKLIVVASEVARELGTEEFGYKLAYNVGEGGGQVIPHIHLHIIGKTKPEDLLNSVVK